MAEVEVEIIGTTIVGKLSTRPSAREHPHVLPLSHLDTDRNCDVTFRSLRIYTSSTSNPDDPSSIITNALSAALHHYQAVAGTLRRRAADGRLELHCDAGQGVPVTTARCNGTLESLGYLEEPGLQIAEGLVPDPVWGAEEVEHPLMVQVTRFACGGFVLGVCFHHSLVDGNSSTLFLSAVAEIARRRGDGDSPSVEPVWDRAALLGPREPPAVNVDFDQFLTVVGRPGFFDPYERIVRPGHGIERKCFHVNETCVDRFRAQLGDESDSRFTTFEALSAFVWRARMKAKRPAPDTTVKLVYSMSIRKIVKPPLPSGYWGNVCVPAYVCMRAGELVERPTWETAMRIRDSKRAVTDEYVRSYLDFQELHYKEGITAGEEISQFTDWRHLDHAGVDFGWGEPVTILPLSFRLLGSTEPCFFLPYAPVDGKRKDGFKVLVSLASNLMPDFRLEMEMFRAPGADL